MQNYEKNSIFVSNMKHLKIFIVLMAVFLSAYGLLMHSIPFVIDDLPYSRSFVGIASLAEDTDASRTVDGLQGLVESQVAHYMAVNGRVFTHTLLQIFCAWFTKDVYNAFAVVLMLSLCWLTARMASSRLTLCLSMLVPLLLFVVYNEPCIFYGGVTESLVYMLPPVICSVLLLLTFHRKTESAIWWTILPPTALLAGLSHEVTSVPFSAAFLFVLLFQRRHLTALQQTVAVVFMLASAALVFVPSMFVRLSLTDTDNSGMTPPMFHLYVLRMMRIFWLWAMALCLHLWKNKDKDAFQNYARKNAFLLVALAASVAFNLMLGAVNGRVVYGTEFISLVLLLRLLPSFATFRKHRILAGTLSTIVASILLIAVWSAEKPYIEELKKVEMQVARCSGDTCVVTSARQDSFPPQIQKYIVATLCPFQIEQFRWKYGKKAVILRSEEKPTLE